MGWCNRHETFADQRSLEDDVIKRLDQEDVRAGIGRPELQKLRRRSEVFDVERSDARWGDRREALSGQGGRRRVAQPRFSELLGDSTNAARV